MGGTVLGAVLGMVLVTEHGIIRLRRAGSIVRLTWRLFGGGAEALAVSWKI